MEVEPFKQPYKQTYMLVRQRFKPFSGLDLANCHNFQSGDLSFCGNFFSLNGI